MLRFHFSLKVRGSEHPLRSDAPRRNFMGLQMRAKYNCIALDKIELSALETQTKSLSHFVFS